MNSAKDFFNPINLQLFGEENGADPNAGGENAAQGAQEPAEQPRTYTEGNSGLHRQRRQTASGAREA